MNCSRRNFRPRSRVPALKLACDFAAVAALCVFATSALAAPPKINRLSVRGFQAGGTTRILVAGTNFGTEPKLVLSAPIKSQARVGKLSANDAGFDVTLAAGVPTGVYHLRIRTGDGLSPAELVTIDPLPQIAANAAPSIEIENTPAAVHGLVSGAAVQEILFTGTKGQTITLDVLAARFGSKLRPVVHLYDSQKRQLAWSAPQTALAGDARLSVTLPADGKYTVAVHDLAYAAATPGHFRLAIGALDYADQVFPPVTARSASTPLELIGRFGEQPTVELTATAAARVTADDASQFGDDRPLPWPDQTTAVGLRPHVQLSDLPELVEDALSKSRQLTAAPVAVSGRLLQPGEIDLYHLELAANEKVRIEVLADRYGSPLDATLEVRDAKGARLAQADDVAGPDPRLDYTAAKDGAKVTLAVGDALRRGGANCVYRLVITKLDDAKPQPDFRLSVSDETHNVPSGGTKVFRVLADRSGYDGPIRLTVDGLPPGLAAAAVEIPAQADGALVELQQSGADRGESYSVSIVGRSVGAEPAIVRRAASSVHPLARLQPWLAGESAAAAMETAVPLSVEWIVAKSDGANTADDDKLYLGTDEKRVVRLKRDPQATETVRLSLITTQTPPIGANAAQAALQQLRGVAATLDVKSDPKKENVSFAIRVPADLRQADYDVALKAELLSADGKTVIGEAYTPPRRFTAVVPLDVALAEMKPIAAAKQGPTAVALTGELTRFKNYAGDVTLSLAGLPKEAAPVQPVVLKAKDAKFRIEFRLPPSFAAERIEGVKLVAAITPDNRRVNNAGSLEVAIPTIAFTKSAGAAATVTEKPAAATKPARPKPARIKPAK